MSNILNDIAALATPPGEGGIAIIRMSGENVVKIIGQIFKPYQAGVRIEEKSGYSLTLGWIVDDNGDKIDEVLLGLMLKPKSYTGEDVVEINCHGGILPARRCLQLILSKSVRIAEAGEFTRRAFLNGRLDVSQAEAVIDIIRAKTEKALSLAMRQLGGQVRTQINQLEEDLVGIQAMLEASIDFPDDVGEPEYKTIAGMIKTQIKALEKIQRAGQRGEIYREGITVAIGGKPNVGKSSLLNLLLKKDKAIVTHIPGTTRDIIEDYISIRGIPVKIMDTAGIRETDDLVERIGVEKSRRAIKEADIVIFLLDFGAGLSEEDDQIFRSVVQSNLIIMVNKDDLQDKKIDKDDLQRKFAGYKLILGSVKEERGLEELEKTIEEIALSGKTGLDDLEFMLNLRQKEALEKAMINMQVIMNNLGEVSIDCLAVDLWGVLESLGEISGRNIKEEVLDRVFKEFCIGK